MVHWFTSLDSGNPAVYTTVPHRLDVHFPVEGEPSTARLLVSLPRGSLADWESTRGQRAGAQGMRNGMAEKKNHEKPSLVVSFKGPLFPHSLLSTIK